MGNRNKSKVLLLFCFAIVGAMMFSRARVRAQYTALPPAQPVQPLENQPAQNGTNPAPGNPATNGATVDPNTAPPTSATLSIPPNATAPRTDRVVDEIRRQIQGKSGSLYKAVSVAREGNSIILKGEVPTAADRTMVENTAKSAARRLKVVNELTVHPQGSF